MNNKAALNKFENLYEKLNEIINLPEFIKHNAGYNLKLKNSGYMDLSVELLEKNTEFIFLSLTHYGKLNGDLMADPDMTVRINPKNKTAEALTYQNDYISVYHEVYPEVNKINLLYKKQLNDFLHTWLCNLKNQGFKNNIY
ncbi:MAG: DUF1249 domain-containing protein [bacterium]